MLLAIEQPKIHDKKASWSNNIPFIWLLGENFFGTFLRLSYSVQMTTVLSLFQLF